ncbi:MAG: AAA domain-containing protein [Acidimicrobiia bacterium]
MTDQVSKLIEFLTAYHARRNPPIRDIKKYDAGLLWEGDFAEFMVTDRDGVDEVVLRVSYEAEASVADEIPAATDDSTQQSGLVAIGAGALGESAVENTEADSSIDQPSGAKGIAARDRTLYHALYAMGETVSYNRDAYELLWGFGRFRWTTPAGDEIDHPLLTVPLSIDIDARSSTLTLKPAGSPVVESQFLADVLISDRAAFRLLRRELESSDDFVDPWDKDGIASVLGNLARSIDRDVRANFKPPAGDGDAPAVLDPTSVIYVRRKSPDYQGFLDQLADTIRAGASIAEPLKAVLAGNDGSPVNSTSSFHREEDVLLPLPVNEEQARIVRLAASQSGVIVKGPPGTGKSHTIANLICHYVANRQRVLVVAQKEQALSVLADKVPEEVRDLMVSFLGTDESSIRNLERSLSRVQAGMDNANVTELDSKIDELADAVEATTKRLAQTYAALQRSREVETTRIVGRWEAGSDPSPAQVATWLREFEADLSYIPDPIPIGAEPPLTDPEFEDMNAALGRLGIATIRHASEQLPDLDRLPLASEIVEKTTRLRILESEESAVSKFVRSFERLDGASPEMLDSFRSGLGTELDTDDFCASGWLRDVHDQCRDQLLRSDWLSFCTDVESDRQSLIVSRSVVEAHQVTIPDNPPAGLEDGLRRAAEKLRLNHKLGRVLDGSLRRAGQSCTVDDRIPSTAQEYELCATAIEISRLRRRLVTRWNARVTQYGGPALGPSAEIDSGSHLERLRSVVEHLERWKKLRDALSDYGISSSLSPPRSELEGLLETIAVAQRRREKSSLVADLGALSTYLESGADSEHGSFAWTGLLEALRSCDGPRWASVRSEVEALSEVAAVAHRCMTQLSALEQFAPRWVAAITADPKQAHVGSPFSRAWEWRRLEGRLAEIASDGDAAALEREQFELVSRRRRYVTQLVRERAWRWVAEGTGSHQQKALNSYLTAVKRYGKTGGKFGPRWLREMRDALKVGAEAVPVWIMTVDRALANFRPAEVPPFDVLIVDEASQLGLESIALLTLANRAIIVGDDMQTSPEHVGVDQQAHFDLMEAHLRDIPRFRTLFNINSSLYDIAFQTFTGQITLREHFRCLPNIIGFSNVNFYDGMIAPLRDRPPSRGWRQTLSTFVDGGIRSGDLNRDEVSEVVRIVSQMCSDPTYDGMTIGVISLLGLKQSAEIQRELLDSIGVEEMRKRNIRCGDPSNFQGDERDVIVATMVVGFDPELGKTVVRPLTSLPDQRRVNVAVSRAKNQFWLVHSVRTAELSAEDLRTALIRHCTVPPPPPGFSEGLASRCESRFERDVLTRILAFGYRGVTVQQVVGGYRLDIVIDDGNSRLAIECDGDEWHGPERWHSDRARQEVLERAGWTFWRIRASTFYRDPVRALVPLWAELNRLGIEAGHTVPTDSAQEDPDIEINLGAPEEPRSDPDLREKASLY